MNILINLIFVLSLYLLFGIISIIIMSCVPLVVLQHMVKKKYSLNELFSMFIDSLYVYLSQGLQSLLLLLLWPIAFLRFITIYEEIKNLLLIFVDPEGWFSSDLKV